MIAKRALVTGAGQRLGRAMALALAEKGYDIAVHYASSREGAEKTVNDIAAKGQRAEAIQTDLLDEVATQGLLTIASKALGGPISVLVNNASIFEYDNIETMDRKSWDRHLTSNLRAPVVLTQALARQVPEPEIDANGEALASGLVVNMLDQRVRALTPEFTSYTIAKAGLWTFTQTAAQALAGRVRVNGIAPGPTIKGHRQSEAHFQTQRAGTITGRGSNPEDITGALLYLLDADAVTGQMICVDGGQHLGWQTPDIGGRIDR